MLVTNDSLSASYQVTLLHNGLSAALFHPNPLLYYSHLFFKADLVSSKMS